MQARFRCLWCGGRDRFQVLDKYWCLNCNNCGVYIEQYGPYEPFLFAVFTSTLERMSILSLRLMSEQVWKYMKGRDDEQL